MLFETVYQPVLHSLKMYTFRDHLLSVKMDIKKEGVFQPSSLLLPRYHYGLSHGNVGSFLTFLTLFFGDFLDLSKKEYLTHFLFLGENKS